jgi:hypothetical protein
MPGFELHVSYPHEWSAVHDLFNKKLRVEGDLMIEHGGFAVSMKPTVPQGFNPAILLMDIQFNPTGESAPEQVVEYEQPWNDGGIDYKEVVFLVVDHSADAPPDVKVTDIKQPA